MDLSLLNQISGLTALTGYIYAVFYGQILIGPIVKRTYEIVDPCKPPNPEWQPLMTGAIERILYLSTLLVGKGEFVIFWVGIKMALQYGRWFPEKKSWVTRTRKDEDAVLKGRQRFMCALNGNGLSILHSFVSFLVIHWLHEEKDCRLWIAAGISAGLCLLSVVVLDWYKRKGLKELNVRSFEKAKKIIEGIYTDELGLKDCEQLEVKEKYCTAFYKVRHKMNKTKVKIPKGCFPGDIDAAFKRKIADEFLQKLAKPSRD